MQASELSARARSVGQLGDIVQAMRTLASARRRQAQERFSGLERYAAATRRVLADALALVPAGADPDGPTGVRQIMVLFSEHGFVGALNERLLDEARALGRTDRAEIIAVGTRGRRLCRERGTEATDGGTMPTTVAAVHATSLRLIEQLFGAVAEGRVAEMRVVFAEHAPPIGWKSRALRLFPPEIPAMKSAQLGPGPIRTLEPHLLVSRAIEEYAFAQVIWAVSEAFASEQAARFVAMDTARHHIEGSIEELRALERRLRQESITNEILEIASGAGPSEVAW